MPSSPTTISLSRNVVIVDEIDNVLMDQGRKTYSYVSPFTFDSNGFTQAQRF